MVPGALPSGAGTAPIADAHQSAEYIPASTSMPSGPDAEPPSGYVAFCLRDPDQCIGAANAPSQVALSASAWQTLVQVNTAWNTAVKPEDDAAHYGVVDYWTIPKDGYGDCEDYALGKRKSLIDRGFPIEALRIAVARTPEGEAHAVLTVATDHGDYVLDNLQASVVPWADEPYTWLARQAPGKTQWASLYGQSDQRMMVATSQLMP